MISKIRKLFRILAGSAFLMAGAAHGQTNLEITANDTMQYNVKAFEVVAGEEVTMTLKNVGQLPKAAMGHNLIILKPGSNVITFGTAAVGAVANDYVPQDAANQALILAQTILLGPGEEDTITFILPEAGVYPFLCSFPGHFALMQGTITAK